MSSIAKDQNRLLLVMATGTGKTAIDTKGGAQLCRAIASWIESPTAVDTRRSDFEADACG
jgi:hypothetical protein